MARIALIGYGKMGKAIEAIAKERGNDISVIVDLDNPNGINDINPSNTDVAIEFTRPDSAFNNIKTVITNGVPVVSGTTGWLDNKPAIEALSKSGSAGGFFYASNFSVGVNLFFNLNKKLAKLMKEWDYNTSMEEIHHIHKLDEPSGTAITLAEGIIENSDKKTTWTLDKPESNEIHIEAIREGEVPGTHVIKYDSPIDSIEIKHTAHNRTGFATGAVLSAEWMVGKSGVFGMEDMLQL